MATRLQSRRKVERRLQSNSKMVLPSLRSQRARCRTFRPTRSSALPLCRNRTVLSKPWKSIHSRLDGGMNRVFLAQVGGSIPPARVPPSKSQPSPPIDNNDSFASRLFGLFGWKSAPRPQVASADSTTLERGAHPAATGSILAPKIKLTPQVYTVASAAPNEMQEVFAQSPLPLPQQEAA